VIQDSTKISKKHGVLIQKATGTYKGRTYIAFFVPQIPINLGPYKFDGLPGLIVSLKDTDSNYVYYLESINEEKLNGNFFNIDTILEKYKHLEKEQFIKEKDQIISKLFTESKQVTEIVNGFLNKTNMENPPRVQSDLMMEIEEK
jgi:GLPGLI family protein